MKTNMIKVVSWHGEQCLGETQVSEMDFTSHILGLVRKTKATRLFVKDPEKSETTIDLEEVRRGFVMSLGSTLVKGGKA